MKKALFKDSVKEIKNTYKRFLSILVMAFLGVGFFAGIKATSPDMVDTIDKYYKEQNVYDIQVMSTLGLTNQDLEELKKVENVESVEGTFETDGKLDIGNKEIITRVMPADGVNKPRLIEGKLPEKADECAVEELFLKVHKMQIGDKITLEIDDITTDDGEEKAVLKNKELTIVGTVQSPLYIARDRGNSSLGAGKVNYFMYISKDNINDVEFFTTAYIKVAGADKYTTSSKKYENYIEETTNKVEEIKATREKARYEQLKGIATAKVDDAQKELDEEKAKAEKELTDAEKKITDGKNKIQKNEIELNNSKSKADKEFFNAAKQMQSAKKQIDANEQTLIQKEQDANKKFEELENQKKDLENNLVQINAGIKEVDTKYNEVLQALQVPNLPEEQKNELLKAKAIIEGKKQELEKQKAQVQTGINQIAAGITQGKQEIANGKAQIQQARNELKNKEAQLNKTKNSTYAKIEDGRKKIENAKAEIGDGEAELAKGRKEFDEKIADAEKKLIDARAKIEDIENPKWYILDRHGNAGYKGFIQDTQSIDNIAKVFPVVFFVVAVLISLTSMTRMVEEQRTQVGTLKALGYNKPQIASKYILYASLACIIGGILGMSVGFVFLPKVIWMMYEMMYTISGIQISFNWLYGGMGLILISVCIIGATIYAVMKELKYQPAVLMRPKAPKIGKRVLLERMPFIWKKLSFSRKVTIRNIFRYKKRFLMTIIGIMGCTSLILAGFGLKDSISHLLPNQYDKVFNYDMQITLKNGLEENQKVKFIESLKEKQEIENAVEVNMSSAKAGDYDAQILVPKEDLEIEKIINLKDIKTEEKVQLAKDEVLITDKLAQLLEVKQGDTITIKDSDDVEKQVKIANVVENYISHYIYMSKEMYENLYQKQYETNVVITQNIEMSEEQENAIATEIMEQKEVGTIIKSSNLMSMLDDTMNLLNYVVIVLIVSAGLLAFVVLYNLSNVNISERIRELATIKVLGFYDKEVYTYVTRETVILTIIGIALGILGGNLLNYFIIRTCELEILRFSNQIEIWSYIYSICITVGFTLIVNFVTYFALKKIDMIESLKSVE